MTTGSTTGQGPVLRRSGRRWMVGCGIVGLAVLTASAVAEASWGWTGVSVGIAGNVGTGFALAGVMYGLERRFEGSIREVGARLEQATMDLEASQTQLAERLETLRSSMRRRSEERAEELRSAVDAIAADVSAPAIAAALHAATGAGAIDDGHLTVRAGRGPWSPRVLFAADAHGLRVGVHRPPAPGSPMPLHITSIDWPATESAADVGTRLDEALRTSPGSGPATIDWQSAVAALQSGLRQAIDRAEAEAVRTMEVGPESWSITERGLEDGGRIVIERATVPAVFALKQARANKTWPPAAPAGTGNAMWNTLTTAVVEHLPTSWIRHVLAE